MDVKTRYLNDYLEEEIYTTQSKGICGYRKEIKYANLESHCMD